MSDSGKEWCARQFTSNRCSVWCGCCGAGRIAIQSKQSTREKCDIRWRTKSRSASPKTVRHSHLWGARNLEFFCHQPQTSMTRATVEKSTAGLAQPRLIGGLSFHDVPGLCRNSLASWAARRNSGPRHKKAADAGLGLGVGQLPAIHKSWVAISVASCVAGLQRSATTACHSLFFRSSHVIIGKATVDAVAYLVNRRLPRLMKGSRVNRRLPFRSELTRQRFERPQGVTSGVSERLFFACNAVVRRWDDRVWDNTRKSIAGTSARSASDSG